MKRKPSTEINCPAETATRAAERKREAEKRRKKVRARKSRDPNYIEA